MFRNLSNPKYQTHWSTLPRKIKHDRTEQTKAILTNLTITTKGESVVSLPGGPAGRPILVVAVTLST